MRKEVNEMKYHVSATQVRLVPQEMAGLWPKAKEWTDKALADGIIDWHYITVTGHVGLAIINADSHEELWEIIVTHPFYPFMEWKVEAISDWTFVYEKAIARMHA
ncbi:hypothetical protein ACFLTM_01345 [Candidatus Bipolaricaulota bacterium]